MFVATGTVQKIASIIFGRTINAIRYDICRVQIVVADAKRTIGNCNKRTRTKDSSLFANFGREDAKLQLGSAFRKLNINRAMLRRLERELAEMEAK